MRYYVECELSGFEPWSGAVAVMDALRENAEAFEAVESFIEEWSGVGDLAETDINDFLWFDAADYLWDSHGIDLFGDHEEDEEDEDE